MSPDQIKDWLRRGIKAAKEGESAHARDLVSAVVEADKKNETAWLWLSEVVDSPEDRQICLQNVLVLNSESEPAQRGLARLAGHIEQATGRDVQEFVKIEIEPISPAAAILYPERQVRDWTWSDSIEVQQNKSIGLKNNSNFDDVWEKDYPICSYCAAEITLDDQRCPNCHRKLTASQYLYGRPSPDFFLFITFLLGLLMLSVLAMVFNLILRGSLVNMVWNAILVPILFVLVAGVFMRKFWAYSASIVVLLMTLSVMVLSMMFGPESKDVVQEVLNDGLIKTLAERPIFYVLAPLEQFVFPVQFVSVLLAFLYGIFRVGPDFDRVKYRLEARIDKGLNDSSQFYVGGKNYAQLGMWAKAVLHFRRAVALEPARISYQHSLAEAYSRLGYYQRSMDVLEFAYGSTNNPDWQQNLQEMMEQVTGLVEREQPEDIAERKGILG